MLPFFPTGLPLFDSLANNIQFTISMDCCFSHGITFNLLRKTNHTEKTESSSLSMLIAGKLPLIRPSPIHSPHYS